MTGRIASRRAWRRLPALVLSTVVVLSAACGSRSAPVAGSSPTARVSPSPSSLPTGSSAAEAVAALCPEPDERKASGRGEPPSGAIREVMVMVERTRGHDFAEEVSTKVVSGDEMKELVAEQLDDEGWSDYLRAQGQALAVMGAIPEGTDLDRAVRDFAEAQVLGFYDDRSERLVFIGKKRLSALDRFVLAHELLHALEDQVFDFDSMRKVDDQCLTDQSDASHALAEGSATAYSLDVVLDEFSALDQAAVAKEGLEMASEVETPESVPPFVVDSMEWPYTEGMSFVQYIRSRGGDEAVDEAFRNPPASTEQIIHPSKYGIDEPVEVDVPDLGAALGDALGKDWTDLAVSQMGEAMLSIYLAQHLDTAEAKVAAAGWGGGTMRSWSDGERVAVLLRTVWDSPDDADEFGEAMVGFLEEGQVEGEVSHVGDTVDVLFGSDAATLEGLRNAAGA